ncbi:MAG: hypothetical protein KF812_09390 [Fimbriimonadaceae bacterium]|nr:hypothetical protein [Fimbriimonadaceae bacterium]
MTQLLPDGFDLPELQVRFAEGEGGALVGESRAVSTAKGYPFLDRSSVLQGRIFEDGRTMFLYGPEFSVAVPNRTATLTPADAKARLFAAFPQHEKNGELFLGWFEDEAEIMRLGYVFVRSDSVSDSGPFYDVGVVVEANSGEIIEISSWPYLDRRARLFPDP